ncbi:hypothetical protein [Streptomyces qinzhouensis]|uniref:Uncharacterized protein n=1 Tax=Streptomyces qinzhouensis TaxID=2599401 RepID=A0A5B8JB13_9ACTN|nr:hypothetical protein [Streptomyces qinzhouensis]QDY78577.1 hypothetical protein FQU76_21010 [Streptomyces qinzhouensis]
MRPGAAAKLAAVLVTGALLGGSGCASPAVDPIERLGRRAVGPGETPAVPAAGPPGAPAAPGARGAVPGAGRDRAPVRTPASETPPAPATHSSAPAVRAPASAFRAPAFHTPALAEPATRLLDRLHGGRSAGNTGDALRRPRP